MITKEEIVKMFSDLTDEYASELAILANHYGLKTIEELKDIFRMMATLKKVATNKEWQLMNWARKERTKKKNFHRVFKRAIKKGYIEEVKL